MSRVLEGLCRQKEFFFLLLRKFNFEGLIMNVDRSSWAGKFSLLSPWFSEMLDVIKRDCKQEHLSVDPHFVRKFFAGKPVARISLDEMRAVYMQQILAGNDQIADFIANRWLFRNMDLYRFFEEELQKVSPEFEKIKELSVEETEKLFEKALKSFSLEKIFCFVVINEVAFNPVFFENLQKQALEALSKRQKEQPEENSNKEVLLLKEEMERIKERHEKKIQEMKRQHQQEIGRFQNEILSLKKELSKKEALLKA
jgi:hypothetical protein